MLEEYVFDRLPETETAALEEHILVCEVCQYALTEVDEFILAMKEGAAAFEFDPPSAFKTKWARFRQAALPAVEPPWVRAALVVAAIAVALLIPAGLIKGRLAAPGPEPARIVLVALRGSTFSEGPARRRLTLSIDPADLPAAEEYRAEVVNASGRRVWESAQRSVVRGSTSGPATPSSAALSLSTDRGFEPGTYWVRLYISQGRLLREFGLRLQ